MFAFYPDIVAQKCRYIFFDRCDAEPPTSVPPETGVEGEAARSLAFFNTRVHSGMDKNM